MTSSEIVSSSRYLWYHVMYLNPPVRAGIVQPAAVKLIIHFHIAVRRGAYLEQ
jgi:hypothetical protein